MVAVEVGARYPLLPSALVLVDPGPIDPLPATVKSFAAAPEHLAGPRGEDVRRLWVEDFGTRDEEIAQWIVDMMSAVPLPIATAVIRALNDWNGVGAFSLFAVPMLLVGAHLGADSQALRLRALKPDLQIGVTVGAGHFHHIEVPEQVNAIITRFLEISL